MFITVWGSKYILSIKNHTTETKVKREDRNKKCISSPKTHIPFKQKLNIYKDNLKYKSNNNNTVIVKLMQYYIIIKHGQHNSDANFLIIPPEAFPLFLFHHMCERDTDQMCETRAWKLKNVWNA